MLNPAEPEHNQQSNAATGDGDGLKALLLGIGAGVAVISLLVAAYVIGYNRGQGVKPGGGGGAVQTATSPPTKTSTQPPKQPAGFAAGKGLFSERCGSCHIESVAGATGAVGPNLDQLKPDAQAVLRQIKNGSPGMPAGLATGKEAQQIADFVASATGAG